LQLGDRWLVSAMVEQDHGPADSSALRGAPLQPPNHSAWIKVRNPVIIARGGQRSKSWSNDIW
jgi:hypothetical protein